LERAILHRLFDDQLQGNHFPEAESVIWQYQQQASDGESFDIAIVSSGHWLDELRETKEYGSTAHGDGP
jgi:hypothetical protein